MDLNSVHGTSQSFPTKQKSVPTGKDTIKEMEDTYLKDTIVFKEGHETIKFHQEPEKWETLKPGESTYNDKKPSEPPKPVVIKKEVEFKSGIKVTEDTEENKLTISRNDNNNNPQTIAVLENAHLTLPMDNHEEKEKFSISIENNNIKQKIFPDGSMKIEDKKNGIGERNIIPDEYYISNKGDISGFTHEFIVKDDMKDADGKFESYVNDKVAVFEKSITEAHERPNGVIEGKKECYDSLISPFITREQIIGEDM